MLEAAIIVLILLASFDLWVGVSNDAVNFLNSAIGSQVSRRRTIFIIATVGIVIGALLSDGMMEVARKGIFDPGFFRDAGGGLDVTAIVTIYLGVMFADVILLDFFNTIGLPTSTTVSIVSELLGASVAVAFWTHGMDPEAALSVVNWGPAGTIYLGIILSVALSFGAGLIVMFLLRALFGRDAKAGFKRFGALWTGLCTTALFYFIVFKAGKNVSFIGADAKAWVQGHVVPLMGLFFAVGALLAHLSRRRPERVFKAIILVGTGSLAAAFAGNDLVNFIGPTIAGAQAVFMEHVNLAGKVQTPIYGLLAAGALMALALWRSGKARTVSDTEVRLAAEGNLEQRFKTSRLARRLVGSSLFLFRLVSFLVPLSLRRVLDRRTRSQPRMDGAPYDPLRATANLTIAFSIISIGTANKLPLSTTYVTFMVAMGAALGDRIWGDRRSAESRITGVLVVLGGWLMTALLAAAAAFIAATTITLLGLGTGMGAMTGLLLLALVRMYRYHHRTFRGRDTVSDMLDRATGRRLPGSDAPAPGAA